jgi:hypothetical protein
MRSEIPELIGFPRISTGFHATIGLRDDIGITRYDAVPETISGLDNTTSFPTAQPLPKSQMES